MATFWVAKAGTALRTIGAALNKAKAGDTIVVGDGTYKENVWIGCDDITLRAANEGKAKIDASGDGRKGGIMIGADGVTVDGFEVYGSQRSGISAVGVEDVTITDSHAHHNKRGGIYVGKSGGDILIEGNETNHNAHDGPFSGISVHMPENVGREADKAFDIIVRGNHSHHNLTVKGKYHTDGNGIILDDYRRTKAGGEDYRGQTLVEDNKVHHNGGAGVIAVWSDHVTIRDNFAFHNNQDKTRESFPYKGEISVRHSSDVDVIGNVAVVDRSASRKNKAIANSSDPVYVNRDVTFKDNFTFNGTPGQASVIASKGDLMPRPKDNHFGVDPGIHMDDDGGAAMAPWSPVIGTGIDWL